MQAVSVHQDSVDSYLEDIVLASMEREADEQARREIQEMAAKIDGIAAELQGLSANDGYTSCFN